MASHTCNTRFNSPFCLNISCTVYSKHDSQRILLQIDFFKDWKMLGFVFLSLVNHHSCLLDYYYWLADYRNMICTWCLVLNIIYQGLEKNTYLESEVFLFTQYIVWRQLNKTHNDKNRCMWTVSYFRFLFNKINEPTKFKKNASGSNYIFFLILG